MAIPSSSRNGATTRLVGIHTAEGARTKEALGVYFNSGVAASSHVGIDAGGVQPYVDYSRAAWTLRSGNPISENAELCAFSRWSREQWLGTATVDGCANPRQILINAAAWTRSRCEARGIPKVKLSPADVRAGRWGVIGHVDWTLGMGDGTHTDPGGNFPWDVFMALVNGANPFDTTPPPPAVDYMEDELSCLTLPATGTETRRTSIGRPWVDKDVKMFLSTGWDGRIVGRIWAWAPGHVLKSTDQNSVDGAWQIDIAADHAAYFVIPGPVVHVAIEYQCTQDVSVSWVL